MSVEAGSPESERQYHYYASHTIPWYVHVLWVSFWIFAIGYMLVYALPSVGPEIANPP